MRQARVNVDDVGKVKRNARVITGKVMGKPGRPRQDDIPMSFLIRRGRANHRPLIGGCPLSWVGIGPLAWVIFICRAKSIGNGIALLAPQWNICLHTRVDVESRIFHPGPITPNTTVSPDAAHANNGDAIYLLQIRSGEGPVRNVAQIRGENRSVATEAAVEPIDVLANKTARMLRESHHTTRGVHRGRINQCVDALPLIIEVYVVGDLIVGITLDPPDLGQCCRAPNTKRPHDVHVIENAGDFLVIVAKEPRREGIFIAIHGGDYPLACQIMSQVQSCERDRGRHMPLVAIVNIDDIGEV